jgi:Na+/melibiose symporter-like transporter
MLLMKNELVSSLVVASLVSFLVWINLPADPEARSKKTVVKAFLISLCLSYVIFYFMGTGNESTVYDNIIKGEPDF